jgi:outer membrane protein OmpU
MKKILLAGTAIVGAAVLASPAQADLKIDLGGHFRGYAVYNDQDELSTGSELRNFEFKRDMEVHFTGETTTDSGLTVGVHAELDLGNESMNDGRVATTPLPPTPGAFSASSTFNDASNLDEAYIYFSGGWGRVNFGSEDGAAYLLQVAAPSADSNVDGMRVYVQALNADVWDDGQADNSILGTNGLDFNVRLGYDNAFFRDTDRLTYLTPKWNGFQAGASYAPQAGQGIVDGAFAGASLADNTTDFEDLWEVAARWDGEFEGFGISAGLGYSTASGTDEAGAGAGNFASDSLSAWDAGLNVSFNDFSVGVAYLNADTGVQEAAGPGNSAEIETWTIGAAWDNGPYHLGATWYNTQLGNNIYGLSLQGTNDIEIDRYTVGGGYTYGPGMTFRGSVAFGSVDSALGGAADTDFVQVGLGTDVNF